MNATQISFDLAEGTDDLGVPVLVTLPLEGGPKQGDRLGTQTVFQYFNGGDGHYYLALLDFEDWGAEACPRFAVYRATGRRVRTYELCQDVAPELRWPGFDAEGRPTGLR